MSDFDFDKLILGVTDSVLPEELADIIDVKTQYPPGTFLTTQQSLFLSNYINNDYKTSLELSGSTALQVSQWKKKNPLFSDLYQAIKDSKIDLIEQTVIESALDSKNTLERMFAIKAHRPEYRDNAPIQSDFVCDIKITVGGVPIDPNTGKL